MKADPGVYQSPLGKLFARQKVKVKAKKNMTELLLTYAEHDHQRIAQLIQHWIEPQG